MMPTSASVEMDRLWSAFARIESWTAIAASPDARFVSRGWRDGSGRSGVRTVDLQTGEEASRDLDGRTVVSIACSSLSDVAVVTVDDDTLTQQLVVASADPSVTATLGSGRWTLFPDGYGAWVVICCHDSAAPVLLVSSDGAIARLPLGDLTVTSVVGVHEGIAWVNAYIHGSANDVRLTMVDLATGRHQRYASGFLGLLLDGAHLVTTTTTDPDTVRIHTVMISSEGVAESDPARSVPLHALRGALTVCAVSATGDQLLVGMRKGIDDSCWLVDVTTGRADRLSDETTAFGEFGVFYDDDPCWLSISPSGALEVRRRRTGSGPAVHAGAFAVVSARPGVPWENVVDLMRTPTAGGTLMIESLVLSPTESDRDGELVVVMLHGGPRARWSRKYDQTLQLFVGAGFRVVAPNTRGSSSDNRAFEQALEGHWGAVDQDDLAAVLAHLRETSPRARILLVGVSYGAYQAFQTALADPDSLDGAVLAAGFPRPERLFAEGGPGTRRSLTNQKAIPSIWARGSSPRPAVGLPVWIVHGQADPLIPAELGEEMAMHLRETGADVEVTIASGAGHQVLDADEDLHDQLLRFAQRVAAGYPRDTGRGAT